jgi:hydrogenase maturation protease
MKRILVAGVGNIFFGDDAFGCEVAKELTKRSLPDGVYVADFGIRSYDLAYAIMENYDATILVDASPRGEAPGTLYLIEPDLKNLGENGNEVLNAHSLNPMRVLQLARSLGGQPRNLYVVGCEPGALDSTDGRMGLSEQVQAAVEPAMKIVEELIQRIIEDNQVDAFF